MTDGEYLFNKTSYERKRDGRGAFAKKGGSRSKRCSLPSDNLTAKQRKELNGVVETVNTMRIYTWAEFKKLSTNMQKLYLEECFKRGARLMDLAEMWEKGGTSNLRQGFEHLGIGEFAMEAAKKSPRYKKSTPAPGWLAFLEASRAVDKKEALPSVEEEKGPPAASPAVKLSIGDDDDLDVPEIVKGKAADDLILRVVSGTLNYEGDPAAVFQKVMLAIDPSKKYKLQIRFQVCDY